MIIKLKWVVVLEAIVIFFLLIIIINSYSKNSKSENLKPIAEVKKQNSTRLLSSRVYSGLLEPKSLLIVNFGPLGEKIEEYVAKNNLSISVYILNMRDGASFGLNEKKVFLPASLNKVPVAILTIRKIERGELSFDTVLEIKDSDRTDTFGNLYQTKEKKLPLRFVLEKMLKESDNTAFRMLQRYIDPEDLKFFLGYLGYNSKDISVEYPNKNIDEKNQFVNVKSMYNLFSSLYLSTLLEPHDSEYILSLLTDTVFPIKKLAELPDNVVVAQKFGAEYIDNTKYFHSCGIIYINESRIFYCIMTEGVEQNKAIKAIAYIVNIAHKYVTDVRAELDTYKDSSNYESNYIKQEKQS